MSYSAGFNDIFGDTLEQPEKPVTKPPKAERQLSITLEKLPEFVSPTPSSSKQDVVSESEMSALSDRNVTPDVDENNPTVKVCGNRGFRLSVLHESSMVWIIT